VCVDLDGLDEIVVTGITGVIVEDDDPRSLSLAVDTILGDRETLASMSRAAREHSREFATETQVNRYVELLDGLARRPRNVRAN
jgi:glycosyltransferase involved in cell wall biosynthesis